MTLVTGNNQHALQLWQFPHWQLVPFSWNQSQGRDRGGTDCWAGAYIPRPKRSIFPLFKAVPAAERRLIGPVVWGYFNGLYKNGATGDHVPSPVCYIRMVPIQVASSPRPGPIKPDARGWGN